MSASKKSQAPVEMDPSAKETDTPVLLPKRRDAYALITLVKEFQELFPETPTEITNWNGRGVGLVVTFDLSTIDSDQRESAMDLLMLVDNDTRVLGSIGQGDSVLVEFHNSPRTQDDNGTFNLADAWEVLSSNIDGGSAGESSLTELDSVDRTDTMDGGGA